MHTHPAYAAAPAGYAHPAARALVRPAAQAVVGAPASTVAMTAGALLVAGLSLAIQYGVIYYAVRSGVRAGRGGR